ncbi:hypothetical protein [uncultured Bifidobacterium sp.]|uniref:hypothetical protein n=1 Tax=uncultured Bifidobacterium sp. TaxID=165187 RepID=UPI002614353D|nr:hypothetical protein [uncultured Bifidobacterium sp.]
MSISRPEIIHVALAGLVRVPVRDQTVSLGMRGSMAASPSEYSPISSTSPS